MQVQFNVPATIGTQTYGAGTHDVPAEDVKENWFFDALVKDGSVVILREDSDPEPKPKGKAKGE
jgi:hypothetical protein